MGATCGLSSGFLHSIISKLPFTTLKISFPCYPLNVDLSVNPSPQHNSLDKPFSSPPQPRPICISHPSLSPLIHCTFYGPREDDKVSFSLSRFTVLFDSLSLPPSLSLLWFTVLWFSFVIGDRRRGYPFLLRLINCFHVLDCGWFSFVVGDRRGPGGPLMADQVHRS